MEKENKRNAKKNEQRREMGIEDDLFDIDESILHDAGLDSENISRKKK